jgi:thioredoxin reductase
MLSIFHCPYCHGREVRDRQLGVLGGSPGAVRYAQIVRQWTRDLVCFSPSDTLTTVERSELIARHRHRRRQHRPAGHPG